MRILLIQPPIRDFYHTESRLQPLGLAALKFALLQAIPDLHVSIRNFHGGRDRRTVALPPELADLKSFYPANDQSPFRSFYQFYHFGADFESIAADVERYEPDLIGISCNFSAYFREVLDTARSIKKRCRTPIVCGGAHASACPESLLACDAIDFVIPGEASVGMIELVRQIGSERPDYCAVPSLWFKRQGAICRSTLPISASACRGLALEDLKPAGYYRGKRIASLISSIGCPYHCEFCSVGAVWDRGFSLRPVSDVVNDVIKLRQAGAELINFEDDNLTSNKRHAVKLLSALDRALIKNSPQRRPNRSK